MQLPSPDGPRSPSGFSGGSSPRHLLHRWLQRLHLRLWADRGGKNLHHGGELARLCLPLLPRPAWLWHAPVPVTAAAKGSSAVPPRPCPCAEADPPAPFVTPTPQGTAANPGINQRALQLLFSEVRSKAADWDYAISVSAAEIYNEVLRYGAGASALLG